MMGSTFVLRGGATPPRGAGATSSAFGWFAHNNKRKMKSEK
jgi:hypothetical protein